jgi:hypothetical protein
MESDYPVAAAESRLNSLLTKIHRLNERLAGTKASLEGKLQTLIGPDDRASGLRPERVPQEKLPIIVGIEAALNEMEDEINDLSTLTCMITEL